MAAARYNILIQKGSTFHKQIVLRDDNSLPIDLTGSTIMGQIRETIDAATSIPFTVVVPTPTNGTFTLTIPDETTAGITYAKGVYDLEIHYPDNTVDRLLQGNVVIDPEVTR